jgi:hypothetical protein
MNRKLITIIFFLICSTGLFANYDEKKILLNNANDMIKVRKYSLAEEIYQEAITKFPQDEDVIIALFELYIRTNKGQEGLNLLKKKTNLLANDHKIKYEITFMLMDKNFELALEKAQSFLKTSSSQADYINMGKLFQRYRAYEESIDIFLIGDQLFPHKFAFELADSYYFARNYSQALNYYLLALEHDKASKNLINSRIRNILKNDPSSISVLIDHFGNDSEEIEITKDNQAIIDIYIHALLTNDRIPLALSILENYDAKQIYTKAEQFKRLKEYKISKLLYQMAIAKIDDLRFYYRYTLNYAQMLFESASYAQADSLLNIVIADSDYGLKRNLLFDAYLLKADISTRNKGLSNQYENLLNQAEKYAYNNNQKMSLKSRLSYFNLLQEDYSQAKKYLDQLANYGKNSNYFFNYYLFEIFQNGSIADSLATELIIQAPESDFTIEMLDIKYILKSLKDNEKNLFLDAYRKEKLFLLEQADSLYSQLYQASGNEYFLIKNAQMNIDNMNYQRARKLLSANFKEDFARDYAAVILLFLEDDKSQLAQDMARNFLTQYPNSSFAAKVRQILMIDQNK